MKKQKLKYRRKMIRKKYKSTRGKTGR